MSRHHRAVSLGLLLLSSAAWSQTGSHTTPHSASAPKPQPTSPIKPYTACHFNDGLQVVEIMPLPPDVAGRTVETMHGPAHIPLLRGDRVFFSYPGTDIFANAVVEQLPAGSYDESKADLISNFEQILSSDDGTRNYALKPTLNGFEIYGLDRPRLEPGALGVYLLIDDRTGIITTVHFLNAEPAQRRFSTLEEYTRLRDSFLSTYTTCAHQHPAAATAAKPKTSSAATHTR